MTMTSGDVVSIIIPAFNAGQYIEDTLRSALVQTYSPTEIILVDDGSTDDTVAKAVALSERLTVLRQPNLGVATARNLAAESSSGAFLAFLDSDDLWERDKIAKQISIFRQYPRVDVVASLFDEIGEFGEPLRRCNDKPRYLLDKEVDLQHYLLGRGNPVCLSSSMVRRQAFFDVGGFYTESRILSADYDLWIRMSERHRFYIMSAALCHYRIRAQSELHGALSKEYGAQVNILRMHRQRFTAFGYRLRLSRLYRDWADSAFYFGDPDRWGRWWTAIRTNPFSASSWLLGAHAGASSFYKRLLHPQIRKAKAP